MLGKTYRFVVLNETGAALTGLTVDLEPWKLDSSGVPVYGTEINVTGLSTTLANQAADASDTIDNSSNKYLGFSFRWSATVGSAQSGTASLYLQHSTDGGTDWPDVVTSTTPDEVEGELIDTLKFNSQTSRAGGGTW